LIIRQPAVAGQFYPRDRDELYEQLHRCFTSPLGPGRYPSTSVAKVSRQECLIVPHAGYIYSGPVAAFSYDIVHDFFQTFKNEKDIFVIILGPNHYGIGSGVALTDADFWETPLGRVKIAKELRARLADTSDIMDVDPLAHSREHSIEVQIPFLQAMAGTLIERVSILPISMMLQDSETVAEVAKDLSDIVSKSREPFLILGSSDLTHYEPRGQASKKDLLLLAEVEKLVIPSFYTVLERNNVSACGYGAIASVMHMARELQKARGTLLKYATSGDTTGDSSAVVGYSAVRFQ
jgi:MEMO1 family protein